MADGSLEELALVRSEKYKTIIIIVLWLRIFNLYKVQPRMISCRIFIQQGRP